MKTVQELVAFAKSKIKEISVQEAEQMFNNSVIVIDVREPSEYQSGHIPKAINIPRGLLEFKLADFLELNDKNIDILIYCKTDGRSALAAKTLKDLGYTNILSIQGGFDAWRAADKIIVQ